MDIDWREEVREASQAVRSLDKDAGTMSGEPMWAVMKVAVELAELRRVFCLGMAGDQEEE